MSKACRGLDGHGEMDTRAGKAEKSVLQRALQNITRALSGEGDYNETKLRRRNALVSAFTRRLGQIQLGLFLAGYLWLLALPFPNLGQGTDRDENALLTNQVNTYWNWGDVKVADTYLEQLETLRDMNITSERRALHLVNEFEKLGHRASTQSYSIKTSNETLYGTNAYAILRSPRASGTEAIVISASWQSRAKGLNLRGVSTVLALANFMKHYSLWAKDIVFVISDGYLGGMQAWLTMYHGEAPSNIQADELEIASGVIWTALNIDYPGHSFSHLGVFFEGLNGRLPNQDLMNSFVNISLEADVPVTLYDHVDSPERLISMSFMPPHLAHALQRLWNVQEYASRAKNILRHVGYQTRGQASGVHGLFHRFRIDAITLYAVPATGPHGFYAIGHVIESTLRTMNNLLERLHASFFFYILVQPTYFLKIGNYLPSAVLISVALMFHGLKTWTDAPWDRRKQLRTKNQDFKTEDNQKRKKRNTLTVLGIMIATHVLGGLLFVFISQPWFNEYREILSPTLAAVIACIPLIALAIPSVSADEASLSTVLKALNLCFTSTVISVMCVLNFSLALSLAVLLGVPLVLASSSTSKLLRLARYSLYALLGFGWIAFCPEETRTAVWQWDVLSVWFAPFVCVVYVPLVVQAGVVCLLPP